MSDNTTPSALSLANAIGQLQRHRLNRCGLNWEWMQEDANGSYVLFADVENAIANAAHSDKAEASKPRRMAANPEWMKPNREGVCSGSAHWNTHHYYGECNDQHPPCQPVVPEPPDPHDVPRLAAQLEVIRAQKTTVDTVKRERDAALRAVDELQAWKRQHTEASCTNPICDCIEAQLSRATRAVEAVRAFPTTPPDPRLTYTYDEGVEAVQALLEGEG